MTQEHSRNSRGADKYDPSTSDPTSRPSDDPEAHESANDDARKADILDKIVADFNKKVDYFEGLWDTEEATMLRQTVSEIASRTSELYDAWKTGGWGEPSALPVLGYSKPEVYLDKVPRVIEWEALARIQAFAALYDLECYTSSSRYNGTGKVYATPNGGAVDLYTMNWAERTMILPSNGGPEHHGKYPLDAGKDFLRHLGIIGPNEAPLENLAVA